MKATNVDGLAPIKLLKVITTFSSGGTEGQVLNLARSLDRRQFDLRFSCLQKCGDILKDFEELNTPISEFKIKKLYRPQTFLQQLRFAASMRDQGIQIAHSYNFYANMFTVPAARIAGVPVVLASIRDRGVYLSPAQKVFQKYVCRLADRLLVNADSIRDWLLEEGYPEKKIVVIKNGIDLSRYTFDKSNTPLRRELGIPDGAPIVVLLSRLNPQKGVAEFVQAAALLNPVHPEARFLIVGEKRLYERGVFSEDRQYMLDLKKLARESGIGDRVIFAGHRTDTAEILTAATISVLPSHSEGLSNTLLESMAAGTPTVATDVGGNPELVKDRVNGLLVPVNSPQHLARAIGEILDNPALGKRFGERAKIIAMEEFSLEKMTADTQALYLDELVRTRRAMARLLSHE